MSIASDIGPPKTPRSAATEFHNDVIRDVCEITTAHAAIDPFTAHIFASILLIGLIEARSLGKSLGAAIGLGRADLGQLVKSWAPGASRFISWEIEPGEIFLGEEEEQIYELLSRHTRDGRNESRWFVAMVARRAMSSRHLWQDLGLSDRSELTRLMKERFPALAARNVDNMKWKKFFFRCLCEMEGFTLCAAPSCQECGDFGACFDDEAGESLLARFGGVKQ